MPSKTEHCTHTLDRYGVTGEDIHSWIDEPSRLGGNHRRFRHDPDQEIPKIFIDKYGEQLARNIILDHIYLDSFENRKELEEEINDEEILNDYYQEPHTREWWKNFLFEHTLNCIDYTFLYIINEVRTEYRKDKIVPFWAIRPNELPYHDIEKFDLTYEQNAHLKHMANLKIEKWLREHDYSIDYTMV